MSEENKPLGMLVDSAGDVSSGRVMKMQAFWTALGLSVVGLIAVIVLAIMGKPEAAKPVTDYLTVAVGMYLAVAVGAEVTQKVTGK